MAEGGNVSNPVEQANYMTEGNPEAPKPGPAPGPQTLLAAPAPDPKREKVVKQAEVMQEMSKKLMAMVAETINRQSAITRAEMQTRTESTIRKLMGELHEQMRVELNAVHEAQLREIEGKAKEAIQAQLRQYTKAEVVTAVRDDLKAQISKDFVDARDKALAVVRDNQGKWVARWDKWESDRMQINGLISQLQTKAVVVDDEVKCLEKRLNTIEETTGQDRKRLKALDCKIAAMDASIILNESQAAASRVREGQQTGAGGNRGRKP